MLGTPGPFNYWGKLEKDDDGNVVAWLSIIDHCADVAACFEAIITHTILGQRLAYLLGLTRLDAITIARLTVLTALHDAGKFNLGFQKKARAISKIGHVHELLSVLARPGKTKARKLFAALSSPTLVRFFGKQTEALIFASIGHHGRPPAPKKLTYEQVHGHWDDAAIEGVATLRTAALRWCPLALQDAPPFEPDAQFIHALNGVITLADWLGSDTNFFPYDHPADRDRFEWAQEQAAHALVHIGLDPREARGALPPGPIDFGRIVKGGAPRGVQARIAELPLPDGPSLTILEAPTGEGKTEAALLHYLRLFQAGQVDGVYFALPTRTAARQLYTRITGIIQRVFGDAAPPVSQAVPGYLNVDGAEGRRLSRFEVLWAEDVLRNRHRAWTAEHAKRYLAGAVVVGTIDQVLLSVLKVPHAHLRAAGLLRLLLVVDEVHASSVYMGRLLNTALTRLRAVGGHALLLSATLGGQARAAFLDEPAPTLEAATAAAYPLVSQLGRPPQTETIAVHNEKPVEWTIAPIAADPDAVAIEALTAAAKGAKVLIIRNTVRRAIETQQALERLCTDAATDSRLFRVDGVITLHHSRFARSDRNRLDAQIEADFGKKSAPGGCVAVGTQTIEQSLDLDADLLLCDLAPMDVLLQRIGRLHRHERKAESDRPRPAGFDVARVRVLSPEERELTAYIQMHGEAWGPDGLGTVYADLRALSASRTLVEKNPEVTVPADCRRLVEHGLHDTALAAVAAEDARWTAHTTALAGAKSGEHILAELSSLPWSTDFRRCHFKIEKDQKLKTRLGEEDRRVCFDPAPMGPFGHPVAALNLPAYWAKGVDDDAVPTDVDAGDGMLRFGFGKQRFIYDRMGLRPVEDA